MHASTCPHITSNACPCAYTQPSLTHAYTHAKNKRTHTRTHTHTHIHTHAHTRTHTQSTVSAFSRAADAKLAARGRLAAELAELEASMKVN